MRFDWNNPYSIERKPVFARDVVATSQPLATQAGLRVLAQGGNALDAALAAASTLALTEPVANGLGSDCFAIVWDGATLHGLNASGPAPKAWTRDYFVRKHDGVLPMRGWDSVTVPGAVGGWAALHGKFGKLSFVDVLAPAIEYAERGFSVSPVVQRKWAAQADILHSMPGFAQHFLPRGRPPLVGEHFVLRGAADTLKRIAASAGRDFYEGETAHKLVAHAQAHEAALTLQDLQKFEPQWETPVSQDYRGHTLHHLPTDGPGTAALSALGILSHFDLAARPADHADTLHLMIEAMKLAWDDLDAQPGSTGSARLTIAQRLDPAYLAELARRIDRGQAQLCTGGHFAQGDGVYVSTADRNGMMVSLMQSNHMGFGSGVVVPGTGVSLQNRGCGLSMDTAHPYAVAGGRRPQCDLMAAFLTRGGAPVMGLGGMDGIMQAQGQLQTLVRMLDYGQQPQAACDAPRWKWRRGASVDIEAGLPEATKNGLLQRGHVLEKPEHPDEDFGSGQFIWRLGDPAVEGYVAASDGRRDGLAAGF